MRKGRKKTETSWQSSESVLLRRRWVGFTYISLNHLQVAVEKGELAVEALSQKVS